MGVLQMRRNRHGTLTFHGIHCLEHGITRGIGFRCCCHIEDRLGKNDLGLRHTNALHRLCRADGHGKCLRIRVSHILCRADHDPAGNELDVLSGVKHACQVVNRRIRVRSAHALDER